MKSIVSEGNYGKFRHKMGILLTKKNKMGILEREGATM